METTEGELDAEQERTVRSRGRGTGESHDTASDLGMMGCFWVSGVDRPPPSGDVDISREAKTASGAR